MILTIDAQSFDVPGAFEHTTSIARLLTTVRSRGDNQPMPYLTGRPAQRLWMDEVVVSLDLEVFGDVDNAGTPHADEYIGLEDNLLFLLDFVADRASDVDATVPATLETHGGRTFTADVQILNLQLVRHAITVAYVSYDLRIPAGRWAETP